ncbi:MAG: alpha/beta fold hydrolase [Bryobacteraceae bacterium]
MKHPLALTVCATFTVLSFAHAQGPAGKVDRLTLHGASLEGNLIGDSPDRTVAVYLPPSYASSPNRRYPVVYMLHGFTDSVEKWWFDPKHWINLPKVLDRAMARDDVKEMIVVMPDALNSFGGSMYSSSVVIGDWERFVAEELVAHIDRTYRTVASVRARGLAGHSMGGYGTFRIGMRRPDVFSAIYAMSACCMAVRPIGDARDLDAFAKVAAVQSKDEVAKAGFSTKAMLASAAAWSPDPHSPPLYVDLPVKEGKVDPGVVARLQANAPLNLFDQNMLNLRRLRAIALDTGDKDRGIAPGVREAHRIFERYGLVHTFEVYDGDHLNRIADRIETKVMPFFSKLLE